jgi:hypothetical protein
MSTTLAPHATCFASVRAPPTCSGSRFEQWQALRAIRNRLTHDYPSDDALKAAYLNDAVDSVNLLKALLDRVADVIPG